MGMMLSMFGVLLRQALMLWLQRHGRYSKLQQGALPYAAARWAAAYDSWLNSLPRDLNMTITRSSKHPLAKCTAMIRIFCTLHIICKQRPSSCKFAQTEHAEHSLPMQCMQACADQRWTPPAQDGACHRGIIIQCFMMCSHHLHRHSHHYTGWLKEYQRDVRAHNHDS